MDAIVDNLGVVIPAAATIVTVALGFLINRRQAETAETEGAAKIEQIQNEISEGLWKRAKEELAEKDNEIDDLKKALNVLGKENAQLRQRIAALEARLDTGELRS